MSMSHDQTSPYVWSVLVYAACCDTVVNTLQYILVQQDNFTVIEAKLDGVASLITDPPPTSSTIYKRKETKKKKKKDTQHVTYDTWHVTCDMWHTWSGEHCLKIAAP